MHVDPISIECLKWMVDDFRQFLKKDGWSVIRVVGMFDAPNVNQRANVKVHIAAFTNSRSGDPIGRSMRFDGADLCRFEHASTFMRSEDSVFPDVRILPDGVDCIVGMRFCPMCGCLHQRPIKDWSNIHKYGFRMPTVPEIVCARHEIEYPRYYKKMRQHPCVDALPNVTLDELNNEYDGKHPMWAFASKEVRELKRFCRRETRISPPSKDSALKSIARRFRKFGLTDQERNFFRVMFGASKIKQLLTQ